MQTSFENYALVNDTCKFVVLPYTAHNAAVITDSFDGAFPIVASCFWSPINVSGEGQPFSQAPLCNFFSHIAKIITPLFKLKAGVEAWG